MSAKFHINPDTGAVGPCNAKIKCAFADAEGNEPQHYKNYEEAYAASEKLLSEEYGDFTSYKPYNNQADVIEEKLDKLWESKHVHTKDAEEIRKTPIYLINTDDATATEITRISSAKGVYTFWDAKGNEVKEIKGLDTVAYSDVPIEEILEK